MIIDPNEVRSAALMKSMLVYRVMMMENPSTHAPHEPETPAMLYPRGGIKVWLSRVSQSITSDTRWHIT